MSSHVVSDLDSIQQTYVAVQIFFDLKIFKPVWFLFSFVSDYDNESQTKENKNQTGLKIFKPKKI